MSAPTRILQFEGFLFFMREMKKGNGGNLIIDVEMKGSQKECQGRGLKSRNFPVGRLQRAKTFRMKRVNHFCHKYAKKVRKSLFTTNTSKKYVNHFRDIYIQPEYLVYNLSK